MSTTELLTGALFLTVRTSVLIAVAGSLVLALRRAPAAARYSVWAAALAGALLLPIITPWAPSWTLWTLPEPLAPPALIAPEVSESRSVLPALRELPQGAAMPPRQEGAEGKPARNLPTLTERSIAVHQRSALSDVPLSAWILAVWVGGTALLVLRLIRSLAGLRSLARRSVEPGRAWLEDLRDARRRIGVARDVRLLRSREIRTPMTWGFRKPVILLPEASRRWRAERRRIVLHHELAHVRRGDWPARLAGRAICALHWLNPLVWLASYRLVLEQEMACDEAVIALGDRPSSYARHLLAIASSMPDRALAPALALDMARRSQMEGRLMSILNGPHRSRARRGLLLPALVVTAIVPALAAVEPWGKGEVFEVTTAATPPLPVAAVEGARSSASEGAVSVSPEATGSGDTDGVARVLAELIRLERELEPFERELEAVESEIAPIESELEGVEGRLEPYESELQSVESELEPFERQLEAIESELEPYERRLEELERELEPFERRLESVELELEPWQEKLEGLERELAPFEERLDSMEGELEPGEERLEAIESELAPFEGRLEVLESELAPFEDELEALEDTMEPLQGELEGLSDRFDASDSVAEREALQAEMSELHESLRPLYEQLRSVHGRMRPVRETSRSIHEEMRPVYERLRSVHEEMRPVHERTRRIHEEMRPVHERMRTIHEEMRPVHERMRSIHEEMQPVHERMRSIHEEMRPIFERMRSVHREMAPVHERMREVHERMGPVHEALGEHYDKMKPHHEKMAEIHTRMRPLHEEMAVHHRALRRELEAVVGGMLGDHLGPIVGPGADLSGAARELIHRSAIRVDDGRLRLLSSAAAVRDFLRERFASAAGEPAFDGALERFIEAYSNLEISAS